MKKIFGYIAIAALLVGACSKPANDLTAEENEIVKMKHVVFGAEIISDDATRATIDDAAKFSWESGDKVAVLATDGQFYDFTVDGTGLSASISGSIPETENVTTIAVYPASCKKNATTITLPSTYSYDDSHKRFFYPMVAEFEEGYEGTLRFRHVTAGLEVSFTKIPSVAVNYVVKTDVPCAGDLDITTGKISTGSNTIKVPTGLLGGDHFFVPMPVGAVALQVYLETGAPNQVKPITESKKTANTTFAANKIKRFSTINIPNIPFDPDGYGEGAVVFVTYNGEGEPLSIYNPETGEYVGREGDPNLNPADYAIGVETQNGKTRIYRMNGDTREYLYTDENKNGADFDWTTDANLAADFDKTTLNEEEIYTVSYKKGGTGHTFYLVVVDNKIVSGQSNWASGSPHAHIIYVNYPD
ncbi:MAG: hypothetical protein IJL56_10620 [Bacteroidales bacterium]|nr:hypothetical protein [Bacteroidales bacterium]